MSRAGRPQKPLPDTPAGAVSAELRRQREQAGLTYRDLADLTGYGLATVTAACSGRRLPSWKVTRACVAACGGDEVVMRGLYEQACAAEGRPVPEPAQAVTDPPDPARAVTPEQFIACMARLRAWAGNPSLAELNQRSGGHLPPSTISGVLRRKNLPRLDLVLRYATACGLPDPAVMKWKAAWENLKGSANRAGGAAGRGTSPEEQNPTGPAPPRPQPVPPPRRTTASSMIARVTALLLTVLFALAANPTWLPASAARPAAGPVTVTLQVSGPTYVLQRGLDRNGNRALAQTIAWASAQAPHQAERTISTPAGAQVFVGNLLDAGEDTQRDAQLQALFGAYLEALDLEGSGSISTTSLTLGGLPAGTAVGLLKGTGRSVQNCSTAQWYIASSLPLIPDSTVCIFRPASPGVASLLSIRQPSARAIALGIKCWYPEGLPGTAQSTAARADLAASVP